MTNWVVTFTVDGTTPSPDKMIALEDTYDDLTLSGSSTKNRWYATIHCDAKSSEQALQRANKVAQVLPNSEFVAILIQPLSEYLKRAEEPTLPNLVSAAEVAAMLDVSRQRVHQLAQSNSNFPLPMLRLKLGPLWDRIMIEEFNNSRTRKAGRPKQVQTGT